MTDIFEELDSILKEYCLPLQERKRKGDSVEYSGTKTRMQGKQKVDGYYFATVMRKPKDTRLYFFPIYTHPDVFELSEELRKCLKGKSCFHLKSSSPAVIDEVRSMIGKGVDTYVKDDLI
jgi:hypothetical protein